MKPERIQLPSQPVIDCQCRRNNRPIGLIPRQGTECRRVAKEPRDVPQIADECIIDNRMRVIEMEIVVEVIRVCADHPNQERKADYQDAATGTCRIRPRGEFIDHCLELSPPGESAYERYLAQSLTIQGCSGK